jgi:membrane fusion protein, multidrug efflux system
LNRHIPILTSASSLASVVAVGAILALEACSAGGEGLSPQPPSRGGATQGAVPVIVATVMQKPMPVEIAVIGTAEPYSVVAVHAQITGELKSVGFKEGDDVRAGQMLFSLDRRPLEAALAQARATLERDRAQAANARVQATRYQDLLGREIVSREQVEQVTANAAALDATVAADQAAVENAQVQLQYATITAPIAGRTGALMVHSGNLVRANDATPLVVIHQVTPLYVSFAIPEAQLPGLARYLSTGSVSIEAQPPNETGPPSKGRISFVDNTVDHTTGTIRIKGTFPNADRRLWPGQFLNVAVRLTTDPDAIVAPSAAVQAGQQGDYVFVVKDDQTVDLRPVAVARTNGSESVIKNGLRPGERVVTDGQLRLVSGSRVIIKPANTP